MKFSHVPFVLLAVVSIALAAASFVEHLHGHDSAVSAVYNSWWMIVLWTLTAVTALVAILHSHKVRRPVTLLLHLSFLCILAGALVTHLWGVQGVVSLRSGEKVGAFLNTEDQTIEQLPFLLQLTKFTLVTYPGTQSPMDYESTVSVIDDSSAPATLLISMNNVGKYGGYRFYQSGYDPDLQGTRLMVSYDPWGIGITYTGYAFLFVSMLLLLILPGEGFRRLLSQKASTEWREVGVGLIALLSLWPLGGSAAPFSASHAVNATLPKETAERFGDLYICYNGRICPFQTMARDFTAKLYGKPSYRGFTAEQVVTGFMLSPAEWTQQPLIKVKTSVARLLGIEGRYASYQDFHGPEGYKLEPMLNDIYNGKKSDDARAIVEADEKMNILLMLFNGELLKLYPYRGAEGVEWFSQSSKLPQDMPEDKFMFIRNSMGYVGELAFKGDYRELGNVLAKLRAWQRREARGLLPSDSLFAAEKLYNRADYTRQLAMLLMTVGIVCLVVYIVHWLRRKWLPRWLTVSVNIVLTATLLYLLFIISLRGYVGGHLPLSNGFETMQFMAIVSSFITLLFRRRFLLLAPFGLLISGLTLLVAMMGESNPQITPLMPVLSSPLLSIHVCVIMVAYSLLAFILLNALTALTLGSRRHEQAVQQLTRISQLMLYPAVFCLAAGIFIGAIWANQSWGRYWGWDPKEVWALITLIVYSVPIHRQTISWLQSPRWFHLYMALAFLSILMTYFGVNFFLGGMHSYA